MSFFGLGIQFLNYYMKKREYVLSLDLCDVHWEWFAINVFCPNVVSPPQYHSLLWIIRTLFHSTNISFDAGFNVETVEYKNISFTVWDVGGQDKVLFLRVHLLVFTTDTILLMVKNGLENGLQCFCWFYNMVIGWKFARSTMYMIWCTFQVWVMTW